MDLKQKYQAAYDELESTVRKRAEKRRYPAMGYTSNLDLLCDFKTERLNELLEEHTPKARLDQMKAAKPLILAMAWEVRRSRRRWPLTVWAVRPSYI